ncbi:MAG: polysaccharide biosynthesis protein [Thermoguttaceae bacterium]|jgi:FlaA1/EpsC-like NDP-sugar epimerase
MTSFSGELLKWLPFKRVWLRSRLILRGLCICAYSFLFYAAYFLSYLTRFDFDPGVKFRTEFFQTVGVVILIKIVYFYVHHHFRNDMFFASIKSLRKIMESSVCALITFLLLKQLSSILYTRWGLYLPIVSSSTGVLLIDFGLTILFLGGVQFLARLFREDLMALRYDSASKPAYMVGATSETARIASIINSRKSVGFRVVGYVAVDREGYRVDSEIDFIPVVGTPENLVSKAAADGVRDLLVVAGYLPGPRFRTLFDLCRTSGIELHVIPATEISVSQTIPIRKIEINDLLKRDPVYLHTDELYKNFQGKRILVTGAGGSIGSEICRQILPFGPTELLILGRGENRIFFLERELREIKQNTQIVPLIANVTDVRRINHILETTQPDFIFHAAAHKHVPLMEANISEAVRNNVGGTKTLVDAADRTGVGRFVLISTDKAVNPTSVMGLTKHLAERYVNAAAETSKTKFIVTRFGNVLGSTGSVVPIFKSQIEKGGPITVTDFRMTRYFMTIPEASQLVLEASVMGNGGEIFVLDMGKPVHILELARDMIRLAGLPDDAIEIKQIGLRRGEKLYEELYLDSEQKINTTHPKLYAARHREFRRELVQRQIQSLLDLAETADEVAIRRMFKELVPEFRPNMPGKPS